MREPPRLAAARARATTGRSGRPCRCPRPGRARDRRCAARRGGRCRGRAARHSPSRSDAPATAGFPPAASRPPPESPASPVRSWSAPDRRARTAAGPARCRYSRRAAADSRPCAPRSRGSACRARSGVPLRTARWFIAYCPVRIEARDGPQGLTTEKCRRNDYRIGHQRPQVRQVARGRPGRRTGSRREAGR